MLDSSEENISNAISWALGWVDKVEGWSRSIGKPLLLEEFGMPRDNFLAISKEEIYAPKWPSSRRDRYFNDVISRVVFHYKNGGAYCGFGFWAYSGMSRPGDEWIGDPPHEGNSRFYLAPGWYGIYDTDETTIEIMGKLYQLAISKV